MRRGAHRSRSSDRDSGQIRLDFAAGADDAKAVEAATPTTGVVATAGEAGPPAAPGARGATVLSMVGRRRAVTGGPAFFEHAGEGLGGTALERSAAEWFEIGCDLESAAPGRARDAYRRALELDEGHAAAHLNLGRLLHEAGDLRGAERHYRRVLDVDPQDATAAFNLGVALEDQHRRSEAIALYERALTADPDFQDAYHNLVRLHEIEGDKAAALRVLKRLRGRFR